MSTPTYRHRYEQWHRESGLCVRCPTPSSKRLCERCYEKARSALKKYLEGRR